MLANNLAVREFISLTQAEARVRVALISHPLKQTAMNGLAALKQIRLDFLRSRPIVGEDALNLDTNGFQSGNSFREL